VSPIFLTVLVGCVSPSFFGKPPLPWENVIGDITVFQLLPSAILIAHGSASPASLRGLLQSSDLGQLVIRFQLLIWVDLPFVSDPFFF